MTRTVHLALVVDGDGEPTILASRDVPEGERLSAYALATLCLETAMRLITWGALRDKERADFEAIVEKLGEIA